MKRRHALSDAQWAQIEPLLPPETGHVGRACKPNRKMVEGIVWILRTGSPWRDLPKHFGPWPSVYSRFRRWTKRGVWAKVLDKLAEQQDNESYLIDATIVRAHQDASGAKKGIRSSSGNPEEAQPRRFMLSWTPSDFRSDSS